MIEKYNGWTNYETWRVALWLDNDQHSHSACREFAWECWDEAEGDQSFTRRERATFALAGQLKEMHQDNNPLTGKADVYSDLLSAAMSDVNWQEIAAGYIEAEAEADQTRAAEAEA